MTDLHGLRSFIGSEAFTALLTRLYGDARELEMQRKRYARLIDSWHTQFPDHAHRMTGLFSTAGRSELAGNHTDHNLGKVIAATINLDTIAVASASEDMTVELCSEGFPPVQVDIHDLFPVPHEQGTTDALVRGIAANFAKRGLAIGGFKATTSTRVLKGSGLSSSAAIEILVATIFNNLYDDDVLGPVELAMIGKEAENHYFGKPSGLMDQVACAHGGIIGIDFKVPQQPAITPIGCDFRSLGYDVLVVDTGGNHADLTADYASIPSEMRAVAAFFGKEVLRDVPFPLFMESLASVRKSVQNDRAILRACHYLAENERVDAMLPALQREDMATYLTLVRESGDSSSRFLQNLYSSTNTGEQGLVLALAVTERFLGKEGACRVHGGGFAGTIQAYVPCTMTESYVDRIESLFGTGSATTLAIRHLGSCRLA